MAWFRYSNFKSVSFLMKPGESMSNTFFWHRVTLKVNFICGFTKNWHEKDMFVLSHSKILQLIIYFQNIPNSLLRICD
jgi:hypothetical protein